MTELRISPSITGTLVLRVDGSGDLIELGRIAYSPDVDVSFSVHGNVEYQHGARA